MPRPYARTPVLFLCIAIVVCTVLVPTVSGVSVATLTPTWSLFVWLSVILIRRTDVRGDEQGASLLSLVPSRAPPAAAPPA